MTNKIIDGDYVKSNGAARLQTVDYIDEVLQNAKIILTAHRGEFYPNKDFGSLISTINAQPTAEYALCYATQALGALDGVCVKAATVGENEITFTIAVNGTEGQVGVDFENNI